MGTSKSTEDGRLVQRLLDGGYRLTPQRRAILRALDGNTEHPTAADIFVAASEYDPSVSLATVYNTLGVLRRMGAVLELPFEEGNRYDPDVSPHANVVCHRCGHIHDVPGSELPFGALRKALERASGYSMAESREIVVHGLCPVCASGTDGL